MKIYELFLVRLIYELVNTYIVYALMNKFLSEEKYSKRREAVLYVTYFVLSVVFLNFVNIPIVMLIFNLISFGMMSMNYVADFKQRLIAVIYIYGILFTTEIFVMAISGYVYSPLGVVNQYSSILGLIANQLLGLIIVAVVKKHKKKYKYVPLPRIYWLCIITVPLVSLWFLIVEYNIRKINEKYILFSVVIFLIINFLVIALYDLVIKSMGTRTEKLLLEKQNKFYEKQLEIMQSAFKVHNSLQHDLKEHLLTLNTCIEKGMIQNAKVYIEKMLDEGMSGKKDFFKTGNAVIDGILSFKFQEASNKGIVITTNIRIPEEIIIDPFSITIILGNVLDNAIDAANKVVGNKEIYFCLLYDRGRLVIEVENTYMEEKMKIENGKLRTSKKEQILHGIGLQNVENAVAKYCGVVDIAYDKNWFKICIMMYI